MPVYEYECVDCDKTFEFNQSMNDESIKICPECGGQLKRILSQVSIISKGGTCSFTERGATCCGQTEPCGRCG